MLNFLKRNAADIVISFLLFMVVGFVFFKNYTAGTFLSGWDNLHPEFNFSLNIGRSLNVAWQEYQGLGLAGGMAHAADLPRQAILYLISFLLPTDLLRYFWTFLMLFLGPLGVYFLVKKHTSSFPGLVAAIFYLLNLATVQYFYTAFDSFVSFYGFFPWLLFSATNYLKEGGKKNLIFISLVSMLATSAFYVQTFFIVFAIFLMVISLEIILPQGLKGIKKLFALGFIIFVINSYWLLPVGYYTIFGSKSLSISHQNSIATPEIKYFNNNRANFADISNLKGFWFDYRDFQDDTFKYVINEDVWKTTPTFFFVAVVGAIVGLFKRKAFLRFSLPILFAVSYLMLSGYYQRLNIPLINEMFRSVFTKWSVVFAFLISIGMGIFINFLLDVKKIGKIIGLSISIILISLIFYYSKPVFEGNLIYPHIKQDIPDEYFKLFEFLDTKPQEGRILTLPMSSFWGWNFNSWGYRGSGFIWYGIKQPIVHRSFDVWSPYNETLYNEAVFALYSGDSSTFNKVLKKYQIKYLLLDKSIVSIPASEGSSFEKKTNNVINENGFKEVFRSQNQVLYDTGIKSESFSSPKEYSLVNLNLTYAEFDPIYAKYGDYLQDDYAVSYPFVNLDKRSRVLTNITDTNIEIKNDGEDASITIPIREKIDKIPAIDTSSEYNCDINKVGEVSRKTSSEGISYRATNGGIACEFFGYPTLALNKSYVLRIKGENKEGRSLKIYLQNWETNRMDLEELLPEGKFDQKYFIYPKNLEGEGYSLNVETRSFGAIASENLITSIEFYPIDYNLISSLTTTKEPQSITNNLEIKRIEKYGTSLYKIQIQNEGLFVLNQAYDRGWIAFEIENFKISFLKHQKVNSWSNGWLISSNNKERQVFVLFAPQLLEWGGLCVGIITFLWLLLSRKTKLKVN